jgi:hypothetical protein
MAIFSADFVRLQNKVSGRRNNASQFVRSLSDASAAERPLPAKNYEALRVIARICSSDLK